MYQSNLKDYFDTHFLIKLIHFSNYFDTLIKLIQSHCFYRHFLPTFSTDKILFLPTFLFFQKSLHYILYNSIFKIYYSDLIINL